MCNYFSTNNRIAEMYMKFYRICFIRLCYLQCTVWSQLSLSTKGCLLLGKRYDTRSGIYFIHLLHQICGQLKNYNNGIGMWLDWNWSPLAYKTSMLTIVPGDQSLMLVFSINFHIPFKCGSQHFSFHVMPHITKYHISHESHWEN